MKRRLRALGGLTVLGLALLAAPAATASDDPLSSFAYQIPVQVTNNTSADIGPTTVCVPVNHAALVDGGFIVSSGMDVVVVPAGADTDADIYELGANLLVPGADSTASESCWWLWVESIPAGQSRTWRLHTGRSSLPTGHHVIRLGETDTITVPHDYTMDADRYVKMRVIGRLPSIPTTAGFLLHKLDAYGGYALGVRNGNELFATIRYGTGATDTSTVSYSSISAGGMHIYEALYTRSSGSDPQLHLSVDGVQVTTTAEGTLAAGATIADSTSSTDLTIGKDLALHVKRAQLRTGVTSFEGTNHAHLQVLDLPTIRQRISLDQEGTASNSWTWKLAISDFGNVENDAYYQFVRDTTTTDTSVSALPLEVKAPIAYPSSTAGAASNTLGEAPDLAGKAPGGSSLPGFGPVASAATLTGMEPDHLAFVFMLLIGAALGAVSAWTTKWPALGLIVLGGWLTAGGALGLYSFWIAAAAGFLIFGGAGAVALVGRR